MATGDQNDFVSRLRALLPKRWFADVAPNLNAVLQGFAAPYAAIFSQIAFTKAQGRLATSTGGFLDLLAVDFFGPNGLPRNPNEGDDAYRARIKQNLLASGNTRAAISLALTNLTGRAPIIFEPFNPSDTGGYSSLAAGSVLDVSIASSEMQTGWTLGAKVNGPNPQTMARYVSGVGLTALTNAVVIPLSGQISSFTFYVFIPSSTPVGLAVCGPGFSVSEVYAQIQWLQVSGQIPPANQINPTITIEVYSAHATGQFLISDIYVPVAGKAPYFGMAYGVAGGWGSLALPAQAFITAYRQILGGVANTAGYSGQASSPVYAPGGYGIGAIEYATLEQAGTQVEDAQIYAAVAKTQANGVTCWTRISN